MKSTYGFKGWDWEELAEYFNITLTEAEKKKDCQPPDFKDLLLEKLHDYIKDNLTHDNYGGIPEDDPIYLVCKDYVNALCSNRKANGYTQAYFIGLKKTKHPWTFMRYFLLNLGYMWN